MDMPNVDLYSFLNQPGIIIYAQVSRQQSPIPKKSPSQLSALEEKIKGKETKKFYMHQGPSMELVEVVVDDQGDALAYFIFNYEKTQLFRVVIPREPRALIVDYKENNRGGDKSFWKDPKNIKSIKHDTEFVQNALEFEYHAVKTEQVKSE